MDAQGKNQVDQLQGFLVAVCGQADHGRPERHGGRHLRHDFHSPIGTQVGRAVWQPGAVLWQSADGERRFDTLEALAEDMLGEAVPLAALFDWMAGRPWSALPSRPLTTADGAGMEPGFRQLG